MSFLGCNPSDPAEDVKPSPIVETVAESVVPTEIPTPTPIPTPGPEEYCFARSMARMRIVKNNFYNLLDEAFSETAEMAGFLYQMLDFVYGDAMLDMFSECGRDNGAFELVLVENGYISPVISENGNTVTVTATDADGEEYSMIAKYDRPSDSGCIEVYMSEDMILSIEWVETVDGYALQYAVADTDENSGLVNKYNGYKARLYQNGEGFVSVGSFSGSNIAHIYANPDSVDASWNYKSMYTFNIYKLMDGILYTRISGRDYSHVVGSSPEPEASDDLWVPDEGDVSNDQTP